MELPETIAQHQIAGPSGSSLKDKEDLIFSEEYLLKRPLLQAITQADQSPVLLIAEIDRADEEFEAFLLELLSAFQLSIPKIGTVKATHKPYVILTSNRTRELSDTLKRRCLYHWIDFPDFEKEMQIVEKKLPGIEEKLLKQVVGFVQKLRSRELAKQPGISETLDWAESLMTLGYRAIDQKALDHTLGIILKSNEDIKMIREEGIESLVRRDPHRGMPSGLQPAILQICPSRFTRRDHSKRWTGNRKSGTFRVRDEKNPQ